VSRDDRADLIATEPIDEGRRLVAATANAGLAVRLVGGVAIRLRAPCVAEARPPRIYHDIDLVGERRTGPELASLLETQGYTPHRQVNTLAGDRLLFLDEANERRLDIFLDRIEMCHTLDFRDHLRRDAETLPVADLLLSKLQIVRLTERDVVDVAALLTDHVPSSNGSGIDLGTIESLCCTDWGWWRTATGNLRSLIEAWTDAPAAPGPDLRAAHEHAVVLLERLMAAPKSVRWKLRAKVGERVTWYREPEEIR
jgi:hypothetical protein